MKNCPQTDAQSVYEHGISVRDHYVQLISFLKDPNVPMDNWKLPDWLLTYREQILNSLLPEDIIIEYTIFHDCSKPYCIQYDENGRRHFPNHAELPYLKWLQLGGDKRVAELMRLDMKIHTIKSHEIDEFIQNPQQAITLLLSGLSEIHANCQLFGGIESQSFKIKYKQISRKGKIILFKLFGEK